MATITVNIVILQTVSTLNGAALDAILAWIAANVTAKLPATATVSVTLSNLIP